MIRLSVNVLGSAITLLKRLNDDHFSSLSDIAYSKVSSLNTDDVFSFTCECGWTTILEDKPRMTSRGAGILRLYEQNLLFNAKRQMIADYIKKGRPIWASRIPYGRSEATIFMTKDEQACFAEAGLLTDRISPGVVEWWDSIASIIRTNSQQIKNDIGRIGEKNTLQYEKQRTSVTPKWMSIESNLLGYDVQSQKDIGDPTALLIEVKASALAISEANFHISANEWHVATNSNAYLFHLWSLFAGKKELAIVSPNELFPYIPTNNLAGEWENVRIPFCCFNDKFSEIE